jgi:hypothetical protein
MTAWKLLDKNLSEAERKYRDALGYLRTHSKEENPRKYTSNEKSCVLWKAKYQKLLDAKYTHPCNQ